MIGSEYSRALTGTGKARMVKNAGWTKRMIDFRTSPERYKHWQIAFDGAVARLQMSVDEASPLFEGYELKQNSYDLGVDIELYDAVQRLRFEHPEVKTVVLTSSREGIFCAGANIRMLAGAAHTHKVNFCKFTNETRNSMEDASEFSGQKYLCAVNGTAAGGGYELALACDHIMLVDDGRATVSLPELPLLAVLPGTGGLTRVTDKRKVRRDHADIFCTTEEGIAGERAVDWRLVDECVRTSVFDQEVERRALAMAEGSDRPDDAKGIQLEALEREITPDSITYSTLRINLDRDLGTAEITLTGPTEVAPALAAEVAGQGTRFWPLALARDLDDAILHLRLNELEIGSWIFKSEGEIASVDTYDTLLNDLADDWLIREILLYWKRTLKRLDVTSRTLLAFIEPGSCFSGFLSEILFAADRTYMLDDQLEDDDRPPPTVKLSDSNFGNYPMPNGLSRLEARFFGDPERLEAAWALIGEALDGGAAEEAGLVTYALDDIDWEDEIRLLLEERMSFSPDALTGMEANLRFVGPETVESKIFGRLTAWQNWIFQRPNAAGEKGALGRYGSGERPELDKKRV